MAQDLSEVYDALRKADAVGNKAHAQRLTEYITQQEAAQSQTEIKPLEVPKDVQSEEGMSRLMPSGGPFDFLADLGNFVGEKVATTSAKIGANAPEWAGVGASPEAAAATGAAVSAAIQTIPLGVAGVSNAATRLLGLGKRVESKIASTVKDAYADLTGSKIPKAEELSRAGAKREAEAGKKPLEKEAEHEVLRKKAMESVRKQNEKVVEQMKSKEPPTLDVQGEQVKSLYTAATNAATSARKVEYQKIIPQAIEEAKKKEATGARVDVSSAVAPLQELMVLAKDTPLEDKLRGLISAVEGAGKKPVESSIVGVGGKPLTMPIEKPKPKTFEQLELTARFLKDIGYSSPLEGYGNVIRKAAVKASKELDIALEKFSPKYGTAKSTYAKMSEPLESMNTRLGRAIHGTEGGIKEEAYAKVSAQDLPAKIFSKKEGIGLLVDALAGGKGASAEARAQASKQVDGMVENWLLESLRGAKSGEAALAKMNEPTMKATLTAVPKVAEKVKSRFETIAGHEKTSASLEKHAVEAQKRLEVKMGKIQAITKDIETGDRLSSMPDAISKRQALPAYMNALNRGLYAGTITNKQMDIVQGLISRANTLEEKTRIAKKIANYMKVGGIVAASSAGIGLGYNAMRH